MDSGATSDHKSPPVILSRHPGPIPSPPANPKSEMDRLRNVAKEEGNVANNVLMLYGTERAVARIAQSQIADRAVLKGGFLLRQILPPGVRRTTLDADFSINSRSRDATVAEIIHAIAQPHQDDQVIFNPNSFTFSDIQGDIGIRIKFKGALGDGQIASMIDISLTTSSTPGQEARSIIPTLRHASPFSVQAYPTELVAAEKYQTILARNTDNTRMKDYYDLAALTHLGLCSPKSVRDALKMTCEVRGTPWVSTRPTALTTTFSRDLNNVTAWKRMETKGLSMKQMSLEMACDYIWDFFTGVVAEK